MKDIIKDLPETFLIDEFPQGHVQDGMVRWLADDSYDEKQAGVRYAAIDHPVFETIDGEKVRISEITELVAPDPKIKGRPKFAGPWKDFEKEEVTQ